MRRAVYSIRNVKTGEEYIGASSHVDRRMKSHAASLRARSHCNARLQASWNRHGERNFVFAVLEECTHHKLQRRELATIRKRRPAFNNPICVRGGQFPEQIRKMRGVTLENDVVNVALKIGAKMLPPMTNLSRLIDYALTDWIVKHGPKNLPRKGAKR